MASAKTPQLPAGDVAESEVMGEQEIERKPINESGPAPEASPFERKPLGQTRRLDAAPYLAEHPDKKLMWVNDMNGDVQRWIDAGAEPVPVKNRSGRTFEGITDTHESKWVRAIGGDDGMGGSFWVYLLMVEPEIYEQEHVAPMRERQEAIHRAMYGGRDQSDSQSGLQSYAPHLPTGDRGMNVTHE